MALPSPLPNGSFEPDSAANSEDYADITIADIPDDPGYISPPSGQCWRFIEVVTGGATSDIKVRSLAGKDRTLTARAVGWSGPVKFNRLYKTGTTATIVTVYQ